MKKKSNYYLEIRKKHGLSREKASELMDTLSPEKIEKIENEKQAPTPMDVMEMAAGYDEPSMRNYYCAHDCPMGQYYVPSVEFKELEKTVLQMVAALNSMHSMQERLIDISADGKIEGDEIRDFVRIQKELERISSATDSMQLWAEKMVSTGAIDMEKYNKYLEEFSE